MNRTFPTLALNALGMDGPTITFEARQGDKGCTQSFTLDGIAGTATTLGFRSSAGQNFVDTREGFTDDAGVFTFTIPEQTFSEPGTVICYFYVFSGDDVLVSTNTFAYQVEPQFNSGLSGTSYAKTLEEFQTEYKTQLGVLSDSVKKWMSSADVEGEVKRQLQSTLTSIETWKTTQLDALTAALSDKQTALDKAQADYITQYNQVSSELASLQTALTDAGKATDAANASATKADTSASAADEAKAGAISATANAKTATSAASTAASDAQAQIKALTDKLSSIDADWADQQQKIQASADAQIKTISDSLADWQAKIDAAGTDIAALKATIAEIQKSVPVKTVGGQKPDSTGNIDMNAYATLGGDNGWSGSNDFSVAPTVGGQTIPQLVGGGGRNLVTGTKASFQTASVAGWGVVVTDGAKGITVETGQTYTYSVTWGSSQSKRVIEIYLYDSANKYLGNIRSGAFGTEAGRYSLTFNPSAKYPTALSMEVHANAFALSNQPTQDVAWAKEMLERGPVAHDWSPAPEDYQNQIDTLNNTIKSLQAQISGGGGLNLIDRTGETIGQMLSSDGTKQPLDVSNLMADHIDVQSGHILQFAANDVYLDGSHAFRWNYYDSTGQYMGRQATAVNGFEWTVPDGVASIWVSYPNTGEVSLTDVTTIETRIALLEAKLTKALEGGTTN